MCFICADYYDTGLICAGSTLKDVALIATSQILNRQAHEMRNRPYKTICTLLHVDMSYFCCWNGGEVRRQKS